MLRSALASVAAAPRRLFSTSRQVRVEVSAAPAVPGALPTASTSTLPSSAFNATTSAPAPSVVRGYLPGVIAPKGDPVLELFTNLLMRDGKKGVAQRHAATVLALVQRATNQAPLPLLHKAVLLSSPSVRMLSMRKSAKTVHTPRALNERQRTRTGIMWLLKAAERGRKSGVRRDDRIAREILAVLEGTSDVFKRVDEQHKLAMMNRSNLYAR